MSGLRISFHFPCQIWAQARWEPPQKLPRRPPRRSSPFLQQRLCHTGSCFPGLLELRHDTYATPWLFSFYGNVWSTTSSIHVGCSAINATLWNTTSICYDVSSWRNVCTSFYASCMDAEGKSTNGKVKGPVKRSKGSLGSLGMLTGKAEGARKGVLGSMNGFVSHSGDSGSEGSTEGSEEDSQNGVADQVVSEGGKQAVGAGPLANLNIGMDYWSGGTPGVLAGGGGGKHGGSAAVAMALVPSTNMLGPARDGVAGELWQQDERELKRQRRKQSNRESARRSRLRKQNVRNLHCEWRHSPKRMYPYDSNWIRSQKNARNSLQKTAVFWISCNCQGLRVPTSLLQKF